MIYFDGVCELCNGLVDFVMRRDRQRRYRFAMLQSERGQQVLRDMQLDADEFDTFILEANGKKYVKSTAALRIAKHLPGLWPLLYLLIAVPRPLRDAVYSWIGNRRYRIWGRREVCRVPTDEERRLFLE